jgi:hypothetical protein
MFFWWVYSALKNSCSFDFEQNQRMQLHILTYEEVFFSSYSVAVHCFVVSVLQQNQA